EVTRVRPPFSTNFSTMVLKTSAGVADGWADSHKKLCLMSQKAARFSGGFAERLPVSQNLSRDFFQHLLIDIKVGVDVLHVFVIFEGFEQTDHLRSLHAFQFDVGIRNHGHAGGCRRDAGLLYGLEHDFVGMGFGNYFAVVAIVLQVFAAGFDDDVHQVIFLGRSLRNDDVPLLVEHIRDGARGGHVAVVLAEDVPDFADRAIAVIGGDLGKQSDSARAVALEHEFFVGKAGKFAGAALDGA